MIVFILNAMTVSPNLFTEVAGIQLNVVAIFLLKRLLELATTCVRGQDVATEPTGHR